MLTCEASWCACACPQWTVRDVESATRMLWEQITTMPDLHMGIAKRTALQHLVRGDYFRGGYVLRDMGSGCVSSCSGSWILKMSWSARCVSLDFTLLEFRLTQVSQ